jgi:hypothetical protein
MDVREVLNQVYLSNPLRRRSLFVLIVVAAMLALRVARDILARWLHRVADRTETDLDDLTRHLVDRTRVILMSPVALYAGSLALALPQTVTSILRTLAIFRA